MALKGWFAVASEALAIDYAFKRMTSYGASVRMASSTDTVSALVNAHISIFFLFRRSI